MSLLKTIVSDLNRVSGKSFTRKLLSFFFNPSFGLMFNYRLGNYLSKRRNIINNIIILYLRKRQINKYSCDISYHAVIGKNVHFPHPIGIVIGVGSIIEDNVMIWQNVTLGSKGHSEKEYPYIESDVKIYTGSQIIGGVRIGSSAKIGAFSLVLKDVPEYSVAFGIPAKVIK